MLGSANVDEICSHLSKYTLQSDEDASECNQTTLVSDSLQFSLADSLQTVKISMTDSLPTTLAGSPQTTQTN